MNPIVIELILHEVLCFALIWSAFCRSAVADKSTKPSIRASIFLTGVAASVGIGAPFYGWEPNFVTLLILFSFTAMQISSARLWSNGVPHQFTSTKMLHP